MSRTVVSVANSAMVTRPAPAHTVESRRQTQHNAQPPVSFITRTSSMFSNKNKKQDRQRISWYSPAPPPVPKTPSFRNSSYYAWMLPHMQPPPMPQLPPKRQKIYFYHKDQPYFTLSNFAPFSVDYKGKRYPTGEHLYQSLKFESTRPDVARHIRKCSESPRVALSEVRMYKNEIRRDWPEMKVQKMDMVLRLKFEQQQGLLRQLLKTGDAELIFEATSDPFWGIGRDGLGRNELGKALMRQREAFFAEKQRNRESRYWR